MPPVIAGDRTVMTTESLPERALRMAMHAVLDGADPALAAALHGVALADLRSALGAIGRHHEHRMSNRVSQPKAERRKLQPEQEMALHALMRAGTPDALGGGDALWTREAARWLVERETGLHLPERTLSSYLERWGFAPEKPLRTLARAHPARMREWLKRDYPVIAMLAREARGTVLWWGHGPLLARQQGKLAPGATPALIESPLWEAGSYQLLFINGNRGHVRWRVHEGSPTVTVIIDALERLLQAEPRRVFLIVPPDGAFKAPDMVAWAQQRRDRIGLHLFDGDRAGGPAQ